MGPLKRDHFLKDMNHLSICRGYVNFQVVTSRKSTTEYNKIKNSNLNWALYSLQLGNCKKNSSFNDWLEQSRGILVKKRKSHFLV